MKKIYRDFLHRVKWTTAQKAKNKGQRILASMSKALEEGCGSMPAISGRAGKLGAKVEKK